MSIEEDVKRCKELIKIEHANWIGMSNQSAISNVLAELEQDKKRIQELRQQVRILDEAYTGVIKESKKWFDIAHNSIPKQAVIEALEDIEDYFDRLNGPDEDIDYIRQVKKELLEGEK